MGTTKAPPLEGGEVADGETDTEERSGAVVYVESVAETASAAVSVGWRAEPGMVRAAAYSLASGRPDRPVVRYPWAIGLQMQSTLIMILLTAGIIATPENDTMTPEHVLVLATVSDLPLALRPSFMLPGHRP
ncbi:hypothetical protein [Streptomyces sp. NPDC001222]|uniref:hypothetical protein n=1 Tax=Streptomyces sp. NPDC001222 TaxID=3364548 RepID=UPI00367EE457